MSNSLGIYFGSKVINIVETKGKKVVNNIQIARSLISTAGLEEKVPEEVKIVALFKDELRRNKIELKEANLCLSGRDIIIRNFELLPLSQAELASAVTFEAKKYIPFRTDELVSDFQTEVDRSAKKSLILYIGIKKDVLDKYASIFNQLDMKISSIEYSPFSALRFLRLAGLAGRGTMAIINADFKDETEVNFTVLQNGFPLFSRDISLTGEVEEFIKPEGMDSGMTMEKLKTEIRISLDYYHRKFPTKAIEKTLILAEDEHRQDLESFMRELGAPAQSVDVGKYLGRASSFSMSFIKCYGCSLYKTVKIPVKVDILAAKVKIKQAKEVSGLAEASLFSGLRYDQRVIIIGMLICGATFLYGVYRKMPLQKALKEIIDMRPLVKTVSPELGYDDLVKVDTDYKKKIEEIKRSIINRDVYMTDVLAAFSRLTPENLWLTNLSYNKTLKVAELTIQGYARLNDTNKEIELVNEYLNTLKADEVFSKYFEDIEIGSVDRDQALGFTKFIIYCRTTYKGRE